MRMCKFARSGNFRPSHYPNILADLAGKIGTHSSVNILLVYFFAKPLVVKIIRYERPNLVKCAKCPAMDLNDMKSLKMAISQELLHGSP
jgi:translation initiation factor 2 beta subunit (eIF-2beta)/eIF-5